MDVVKWHNGKTNVTRILSLDNSKTEVHAYGVYGISTILQVSNGRRQANIYNTELQF